MELDIKQNFNKEVIVFNNFETIKQQINNYIEQYNYVIVSEEAIDEAKKIRAKLNATAKIFNDRRIAIEREYMESFEPFKNQIKELIDLIKIPSDKIDIQVKAFELKQASEKKQEILDFWNENTLFGDVIPFNKIFHEKMLLKGNKIEDIKETLSNLIEKIYNDLILINTGNYEYKQQIKDVYLNNNFDLSISLKEETRLKQQQLKLEELNQQQTNQQEIKTVEPIKPLEETKTIQPIVEETKPLEEVKSTNQKLMKCSFTVIATVDKLQLLKQFFITNNIKYEVLK